MQGPETGRTKTGDKGLNTDAIGFLDTLIVGLASTASTYSLAAVIGLERPAIALEAAARKRDARLIVVDTYGEGPFRSAILGSTPHKLLRFSEDPVLCVPSPGERS